MSPTYGNAPPALGAADLHVDPQALWDVGLALQRVRDAAAETWHRAADGVLAVGGIDVTDELPEVRDAWGQATLGLRDAEVGLVNQALSLVGVLDTEMINLRTTIDQYLRSEAESRLRLSSIGQIGG
jgi:hypothetical protein